MTIFQRVSPDISNIIAVIKTEAGLVSIVERLKTMKRVSWRGGIVIVPDKMLYSIFPVPLGSEFK